MLEEKASGSGDVRPDLREALAASVAVAPEPVAPKPKKMPFKGEKGDGKGIQGMSRIFGTGPDFVPNYGPPPRVVPAPISLDVKGGKGTNEAQHQHVVPGGPVSLEKGDGKGKGSNATGNLDVKGGKCEKEEVAGKGRAKGKGKEDGKDSTAKGGWDSGAGLDVKGGKGTNEAQHQHVVPGGPVSLEKGDGKGKGSNATGNLDVKGGKCEKEEVAGKGRAKGKGKKDGKDSTAKGGWDSGAGLDVKGGKGTNEAQHQHVVPEGPVSLEKGDGKGKGSNATGNLDVKGGKGEKEEVAGKGRANGKGKKDGKDSTAKGGWDKGHGKGKAKGKGKKTATATAKVPMQVTRVFWMSRVAKAIKARAIAKEMPKERARKVARAMAKVRTTQRPKEKARREARISRPRGIGQGLRQGQSQGKWQEGRQGFPGQGGLGQGLWQGQSQGKWQEGRQGFPGQGGLGQGLWQGQSQGKWQEGRKGFPRQGGLEQGLWQGQQGPRAEHLHVI